MGWNHFSAGESRTRRSVRGGQRRAKKVPLLSLERLEPRTMFTGNQAEAADLAVAPVLDVTDVELRTVNTGLQDIGVRIGRNLLVADGLMSSKTSQQSMTVNQYVDWLAEQAANQWNHLFGQSVNRYRPYFPRCGNDLSFQGFMPGIDLVDLDVGVITLADAGNNAISLSSITVSDARIATATNDVFANARVAAEFSSDTKVQVQGVDEADLIEVDGKTLFALSRRGRLAIVDASDPTQPQVLFQVHL